MVKRIQVRRVAIYARVSVTSEESVSIERQVESARQMAAARGWEVVLVEPDDGVSATHNRPEQRRGWRAVLSADVHYDAVIVWKVDRLARSVLDFINADRALQGRGAAILAVEDSVDMTTPQGRAFAQLLAVFAELEAASTAARVTAARRAIIGMGRWPGGSLPFGYRNIPNPEGAGVVLELDPDRVPILHELITRGFNGDSPYALARWLDTQVPPKRAKHWPARSAEMILRNPILVGMIPYTVGRRPGEPYEGEVYRDRDGNPIIDPSLAIMDEQEREALLRVLDSAKRPGSRRPRSDIEPTLLSGLVMCGGCERPLYRASGGGGYLYYRCQRRGCTDRVNVSRPDADALISETIVTELGDRPEYETVTDAGNPEVARIETALETKWGEMRGSSGSARRRIMSEIEALEVELEQVRSLHAPVGPRLVPTGRTLGEAWREAADDAERNAILRNGGITVEVAPAPRSAADRERFSISFPPPSVEDDGETVRFGLQVKPSRPARRVRR